MKTITVRNQMPFYGVIAICVLIFAGCESNPASNNGSVDQMSIDSATISGESVLSSDTRKVLAGIRSATSAYHKVDKAIADGYAPAGGFVPGMGYHYVRFGEVDDVIDPYAPEALVYIPNPADESKRRLVAVEYIYAGDNTLDTSLLDDLIPGIDGGQWILVPPAGGWTFHAWVWYPNPEGVFNATNSRVGDGS